MDIFIGYLTGCVRYKPPVNSAPKGNSKFENLLVKVFSLKTKNKIKYLQQKKKNQIFTFEENSLCFL